ncbi:MAG: hypothetical protein KGI41_01405 [Patescibacteria group bacterium]|nr:hypothetical protein [Patescibacteria group bacterium]MDE1965884.1 hypothetical protein [Patescibacteria group bacterium]
MKRRFFSLVSRLALAGTLIASPAYAAEVNYWKIPGRHPLSHSSDGRDAEALACAARLPVPADVMEKFKAFIKSGKKGTAVHMRDGVRFAAMTYEKCRIWPNVVVKFGKDAPESWRDAEVVTVVDDDGRKWTFYRPFICDNWSILAPPQKTERCYRIPFDFAGEPDVILQTPAVFESETRGNWPSAAQAYLNPDLRYAFLSVHIDLADGEVGNIEQDPCFGVWDETGFHQGTTYCAEFCAQGQYPSQYPSPNFIRALAEQSGNIRLPEEKPKGAFQFELANGRGELSLPLRYAARFVFPCVAVKRYRVHVRGYLLWHSVFRFDLVPPEEGERSLAFGRRSRGDIYLRDAAGKKRVLTGTFGY